MLSTSPMVAGCGCAACQAAQAAGQMSLQQFLAADTIKADAAKLSGSAWTALADLPAPRAGVDMNIKALHYVPLSLDVSALRETLTAAPLENTRAARRTPLVISLPTADGSAQRFQVDEFSMMEPALAAQFPEIKTYSGVGLDDPSARVVFDVNDLGFHASIKSDAGNYYIDPAYIGDTSNYISYATRNIVRDLSTWRCFNDDDANAEIAGQLPAAASAGVLPEALTTGTQLRIYRAAIAADGEYTAFFQGTVANAQSAIVTALARINQVYERDLNIRMVLVANNASLIYTNKDTDPYDDQNPDTAVTINQTVIDSTIGNANYDIGHVFTTGGGGFSPGLVGVSGSKAQSVTGNPAPTGDAFYIDFVAHEMGHSFNADHTFNSSAGNCGGGTRYSPTAYEPGSGVTIMAYAGICGADDINTTIDGATPGASDADFLWASVSQIISYVDSSSTIGPGSSNPTGTRQTITNSVPTVNGGLDYNIPVNTPFQLTAAGADANNDTLYYNFEEADLGVTRTLAQADNGTSPLFRTYLPSTSNTRLFPKLATILTGGTTDNKGEKLPSTTRDMNFKVSVRDRALGTLGGGGYNTDDVKIHSVVGTAFAVTYPNTSLVSLTGGSTVNVSWTFTGTNLAPINTSNVKISLSTDGGQTFPTVLAASTPNDGVEPITFPNLSTSAARIKIEAVGNVFFDIGNANFTIVNANVPPTPSTPVLASTTSNDTGYSQTDRTTKTNTALVFTVNGVTNGATVRLYNSVSNSVVGSAVASGTSATITTTAGLVFADAVYTFTAKQTLSGGSTESAASGAITFEVDTTGPELTAGPAFNFDKVNPSVQSLTYEFFGEPLANTLATTGVSTITRLSDNTAVPTTLTYSSSAQNVTVTWPSFNGGILLDGNYTSSFSVQDVAGNSILGGSPTLAFFFLQGDANHDRSVDTLDFATLIAGFGTGASKKFSNGDFNYSGTVDSTDFGILVSRYGNALAAPAALPAVLAASTASPFNATGNSIGLLDELR